MILYAYDIECFKNLFTATFINVEDASDKHVFHVGLGKEDWKDIKTFLQGEKTLIGYNNHSYDDPMLRYLQNYKGTELTADLFKLSSMLVDDNYRSDRKVLELRYPKAWMFDWNSIDLMRVLAFDKLGISLKQTAINLKWHKIQDMPVSAYDRIKAEQLVSILGYNLNDVEITDFLYKTILPLIEMRRELSKVYHVDLTSASKSRMANLILEYTYANEMKMDIRSIKDMRTVREKVLLGSCIAKFVEFKSPELQELIDRVSATYVYAYNNYIYKEALNFANCKFWLGIGGLHSEDEPGIFETDDKYIIRDMDVASYYPNLIINNNFYPEHLGKEFITVLKKLTSERMEAKKKGDKIKAEGLKIAVNSIFGKLGSPDFWLLDAKQMISTTLSGQLGLIMLIEDLHLNGIEVISANTDGVVCKIPRELEDKYYEVSHAWEQKTNLQLEYTTYKRYIRRDVNAYIAETEDGAIKEKGGIFLTEQDLSKAYKMPIVPKALHAYFLKGVPVKDTLKNCKDIMDFCISQKTGSNFILELHTTTKVDKLQKTNRYFISKKGGSLVKRDNLDKNRLIGLNTGKLATILNDYDSTVPFEEYQVDLAFYEKEVMKIVDAIEPPQLMLFDVTSVDRGVMKKATSGSPVKHIINEENLSIEELNKLGKNQFIRKIESIVTEYKHIDKISPRYVYVVDFDARGMDAEVYCLAKGTQQSIKVDKAAYKKAKLEKGQLIYCNKFEKLDYGHAITEYTITEKIVRESLNLGV